MKDEILEKAACQLEALLKERDLINSKIKTQKKQQMKLYRRGQNRANKLKLPINANLEKFLDAADGDEYLTLSSEIKKLRESKNILTYKIGVKRKHIKSRGCRLAALA